MIARLTVYAILVLSLASYASTPTAKSNNVIATPVCCDGDPNQPIGH